LEGDLTFDLALILGTVPVFCFTKNFEAIALEVKIREIIKIKIKNINLLFSGFLFSEEYVSFAKSLRFSSAMLFFKSISEIEETIVFYESKHRILKALDELKEFSRIGDPVKLSNGNNGASRKIMIARELTKQFETIYRGTIDEVMLKLNSHKDNLLGEFVVVIGPK